ncbi:hypothetical protein QWJ90_08505 [Microbacterium oryzae]|uniref:hypothetical protein n=1 Tax=Microbacterium oryzae TaxID=743009 RepID=UPI0025B0AD86|nr:hypothetical protein [Microbacterium oryzae]MDN3310970.1 hypothetical protein [Microbacterium oryzae]
MSDTTQGVPFDARALTEPVDPADAKAFAAELSRRHPRTSTAAVLGVVAVVAVALVLVVVGGGVLFAVGALIADGSANAGGLIPLIGAAIIGGGLVWAVAAYLRAQRVRRYRLDRFARANGMSYLPAQSTPARPGMIFGLGHSRRAEDILRGEAPRFAEFANYEYTTGSGKHKTTHRWGYVAIRLDAPLPHIVLDATGNNSVFGSNLPVGFRRDQRLSLEGDFDEHFALYCPEGYEQDALYLFTPDIMARFLDHAGQLDVEIVDDWMFLYTRRKVTTLDPATWAWLFSVVGALIGKLDQWGRWRDDRLTGALRPVAAGVAPALSAAPALTPPRGVAAPGRRLRRRFPWLVLVAVIAGVAFFVLDVLGSGG